jgi:CheY-like chemotaxis protein
MMAELKRTILLVDDDHDFVEMNRHVLETAGYTVACCYDSAEALARLASGGVDLIITDLMMKTLDAGFQLVRQLRADPRYKDLPIILATSVSTLMGLDFQPRGAEDLQAMGVDAFFDKPIPPQRLLAKVSGLLSHRNRESEHVSDNSCSG